MCILIVYKTHRLFRLSMHTGIRYFRNAFFFYGLAFVMRYFLKLIIYNNSVINLLFEFFIIMAGFFLIYSLLWKRFEGDISSFSSLFNSKIAIFYLLTSIIVILDVLWSTLYIMFFSQMLLFIFASVISFINYRKSEKSKKFPRFYFIAMILMLVAWILNTLIFSFFNGSIEILIDIYILNAVFFLIFFYGVMKVTKK